ncbi:hypothetical protein HX776_18245 [Pseudomonas agarici]|uniref:hypothetical protein n=1 Tax=Pseudomonas agarici TaxID=46677 RepID=UPI0003124B36|nr:hypothetical protein [Pseudomonas agarici]NWC10745.1 hypothetical protein [Pseudomonas agarici]SEL49483.1 hypothetical protein SAMN05216604_12024 [Pseudomonas agarici]
MRTQSEAFALAVEARQHLKNQKPSSLSEQTIKGYESEAQRLFAKSDSDINKILPAIRDTESKSTYHRRKAAIKYVLMQILEKQLRLQDKAQRDQHIEEFHRHIEVISGTLRLLDTITKSTNAKPLETTRRRRSKRQDLHRLPSNWRDLMADKTEHGKYKIPYLVSAISGCRPGELEKGIKVTFSDGDLLIRIDSGIKVSENKGQPWREIRYSLKDHDHPLIRSLIETLQRKHQAKSGSDVISIEKQTNFRSAMAEAGKKLWPNGPRVTPYCLRHAFASDLKREQRLSQDDVSAAIGHCVNKTASYYGQFQIGKSGSEGVRPSSVQAARPILQTRSNIPGMQALKDQGS